MGEINYVYSDFFPVTEHLDGLQFVFSVFVCLVGWFSVLLLTFVLQVGRGGDKGRGQKWGDGR